MNILPYTSRKHQKKGLLFIAVFTFLCLPATAGGQVGNSRFSRHRFGQEEGLLQNSVSGMLLDHSNILWIATQSGLCKFDGRKFEKVATPIGDRLVSVCQVSEDTLLAYDVDMRVTLIVKGRVLPNVVWDGMKLHPVSRQGVVANSLIPARVGWNYAVAAFAAISPGRDTAIVNFQGDLIRCTRDGVEHGPTEKVLGVSPFERGLASLDYANATVNVIDFSLKTVHYKLPVNTLSGKSSLLFCPITKSLFLYIENKLYRLHFEGKKVNLELVLDNLDFECTPSCILQKDANTLLVGSVFDGLFQYRRILFSTAGSQMSTSTAIYSCLVMPDSSSVFTANGEVTDTAGISRKFNFRSALCGQAALKSSDGYYWHATVQRGSVYLMRTKAMGMEEERIALFPGAPDCIYEDLKKNIWITCPTAVGRYSAIQKKFELFPLDSLIPIVNMIVAEDDHLYWLATNRGLYTMRFDSERSSIKLVALAGTDIRFLKKDPSGNLWVCTYGKGIFIRKAGDNGFISIPGDVAGYVLYAHAIVEDRLGRFWIPTNNGLLVSSRGSMEGYLKNSLQVPYYARLDKSYGLLTNEFNGGNNCVTWLKNGWLALASMKGVVMMRPNDFPFSFSKDSVFIERVTVDGQEQKSWSDLRLPEEVGRIEIKVVSPGFDEALNTYTEYSLAADGENVATKAWFPAGRDNVIQFTSLKNGYYTLHLRRRTGFGANDYSYNKLNISIIPAWYHDRTILLLLGIGGILLLGITLVVAQYLSRMRIKKQQLIIDQMTSQLREQNDELEQSNELKNQILGALSHDISTPAYFMYSSLRRLVKKGNLPEEIRSNLDLVLASSAAVSRLADGMLSWIRLQSGRNTLAVKKEDVDVAALLLEKWELFAARSSSRNIDLEIRLPQPALLSTDPDLFSIIIYNILDNIIKYFSGGRVIVTGTFRQGQSYLAGIELDELPAGDNGPVVKPAAINTDIRERSRGFGRKLIQDFAEAIGMEVITTVNQHGFVHIRLQMKEPVKE